jgi:hypothetical protein
MRVRRGKRTPPEMDPKKVGRRPSLKKVARVAAKAAPPEFTQRADGKLGPKFGEKSEDGYAPARTVRVTADLNASARRLRPH